MRIALVSPYSWTYPGGVTRHIEALAEQFQQDGHEVRVLAPFDPPDSLSVRLHRGAVPQSHPAPEYLQPLGRTVGIPANGAVSNLCLFPSSVFAMRRALAEGGFDVVHVHEPIAPVLSWDALDFDSAPLVGTYHTYATSPVTHNLGNVAGAARRMHRLHARIAVSEAAAWTAQRFYGGRYRIIPNGVHLPAESPVAAEGEAGRIRIAFVGQAVERKGLPMLLSAFEGLREHVDAELTVVGATPEEVEHMLLDGRGISVLGRVSDAERTRVLREADVLCAPSLGGESFGMVLTEAFAQGTPVVASDIAGYRDVVRDGRDGMLVPRGDAHALAETLRDLALDPALRATMAREAAVHAHRFDWPRVSEEILGVYEEAIAARQRVAPATASQRAAARLALVAADGRPKVLPRRLPSIEPAPAGGGRARTRAIARRAGLGVAAAAGLVLTALALQRIGVDKVAASLLHSSPPWVIAAVGVMCASMVLRAVSWHAILKAALPESRLSRFAALQGTSIGVLMSATLPARLGEPSRALIVARRAGRPRETLPTVVGTLVSQTLLNLLALAILAVVAFSSVHIFDAHHGALFLVAIAPLVLLLAVVTVPAILRAGGTERFGRLHAIARPVRRAAYQVRQGLEVFRRPREGATAIAAQLGAWALQATSCYLLLVAIGLHGAVGVGAAAAVLLAVNVTAVLPATPSNVGVFQAACVAVLTGAYGVSTADALGYGIVLQAVEIATAVIMGVPALLKEGLSWRDVRLRAMHSTPVRLGPAPARKAPAERQLVVGDV
ncbi:MAG TPA: lysylphosphatidylglycerol synthase domain-containing protein [Solirubrobacteraceae bacterium]|nr:lysylphosphatidylglycerol synthase domain-containing protein [Solirubrobacteraceae bacterium]